MSRTQQSITNVKISSISLIVSMIFNFVSRNIFINYLGTEITGLTSTLNNILGFLNIAELGLASTIAGLLYKPLYNKDEETIKDIISIFGYLYRIIGSSLLIIGIICSFFLPNFFEKTDLPILYIYIGYYTYLTTTLVSYFISYKQTLLVADQKEYIVTSYTYVAQSVKLTLQMLALYLCNCGYIIWLLIELVFGIVYGIAINKKVNKIYPWLSTSYSRGKSVKHTYKNLFRTVKQTIPHNVAAFVQSQSASLLIYTFATLTSVTIYTNYTMVLVRAVQIINICFRSMTASFGNLVAEGNKEKIISIFSQTQVIFLIFASIICTVFYIQTEAFISLWLGSQYLLDKTTFIIMIYIMYISIVRLPVNYFIGAYVLFKDVWAPVLEAVINISFAIILGYKWGIDGVVSGSAISLTFIIMLWKPYFLFKEGIKTSSIVYWKKFIKGIIIFIINLYITQYIISNINILQNTTFFYFIIKSSVIGLISSCITIVLFYITDKNLRLFIGTNIIGKLKHVR